MSGNGSASCTEETAPGQDEVKSEDGILHRLGRFLRGLSLRCRRGIERGRQKRRANEDQNPRNSGQKDSSGENTSLNAHQGNENEDETITTEEKTHTVAMCHLPESTIPESTLPATHGNDALQYDHEHRDGESTKHILQGSVFREKDDTFNRTRPSTSPLLDGTQTSGQLHQLLRKEDISEKSFRELSSHINTVHVVKSTSTTRVKSPTRHYPPLPSKVTKDLSKTESLFTSNVFITDSQQPSYLVDSRKTPTIPLGYRDHANGIDSLQSKINEENLPIREPSVSSEILTDHVLLLHSVPQVSIWNRLPSRHKRTLNFSRNYAQYGNNDIQNIELEIQPTVDEWCSYNRNSTENNSQQQNDTPDKTNEENFQPLLKLAITDKPADIPQSRNTTSHNIIECFCASKLDTTVGDTCDLTTVEQGIHVGLVVHPRDIAREYKREESNFIASNPDVVNQKMVSNIPQPDNTNKEAVNDESDSPSQQPTTPNSQNHTEALKGQQPTTPNSQNHTEALKGQQPTTPNSQNHTEALKGQQPTTPNSQNPTEALKGQQPTTPNSQNPTEALKGQHPTTPNSQNPTEALKGQQPTTPNSQNPTEALKGQQLDTTDRQQTKSVNGQQLDTTGRQQSKSVNGQQQKDSYGNMKSTKGQTLKAISGKQLKETHKQKNINSQKLETLSCHQRQKGCGNQLETPQMFQETTFVEEEKATIYQNLEESPVPEPKVTDCKYQRQINSRRSESTNKEQNQQITVRKKPTGHLATTNHKGQTNTKGSQQSDATKCQQSGLNNSQVINEVENKIIQCADITFDEEVLPIQIVHHRQDQTYKATEMCEDNVDQMIKRELNVSKDETNTRDEWSRTQTDTKPLPIENAMVAPDTNQKREQKSIKPSPEQRHTTTEKCLNDYITNGPTELKMSSKLVPSRQDGVHEISVTQNNGAMFENQANKYRKLNTNDDAECLNISSTTKQTGNVKHDGMCLDNAIGDAATNTNIHSNVSTAKRVVVNKAFFISRQNNVHNDTNKESIKEANMNQSDPTKQLSVNDKTDSLECPSGQKNVEPDSKYTAEKLSDKEVKKTISLNVTIDLNKSLMSSSEETSFPNGLIHEISFVESNLGQQKQQQTSHEDHMKLHAESTHDQTTIESDFSDDGNGDLFHSETAQDAEIDKALLSSPQTNPSVTQQKDQSQVLLDKRDRLMKPLMENIKRSNGTSPKEGTHSRIKGEINSDDSTLQKGDKHSNSMPDIQPTIVHNENGKRHVVIKYKRQPYPPERRPLSASMAAFRFRKINGVYGQLKKAQSSEDLRVDKTLIDGSRDDIVNNNDDRGKNTSKRNTKKGSEADPRTGTKSSSNPHAVSKLTSRESVTMTKKFMSNRKPAAPPLLRFNSYIADDGMYIPSLFDSRKRSTGVDGLTKDVNGRTTKPTGQSYLEAHGYRQKSVDASVNSVSLSPRELAFAQKLCPGERKIMPSSEMEKVECPEIISCNSKQRIISESNIQRVVTHPQEKMVTKSHSNTEIVPGLVYSENQRDTALHGSLSGSAASGNFLKNALIERRVVLPSRYSVRSQKTDSSSPNNQVHCRSDPRPRQQSKNELSVNIDSTSPMLLSSKRTYSPRVHQASKRMMIKRDTLPSSSLTKRTAVTSSEGSDNNDQGAHQRSDYLRQVSYPHISSSTSTTTSADCEHDSLMLKNRETENEYSDVRRTPETLDSREIVEECEHNFFPSQNIVDKNVSSRPANQTQYGSSSDPRRRQQLEKTLPGNAYGESKTKPFKSTDYPRLASKRSMIGRRTLSTSRVTRKTVGEDIASDEMAGNDWGMSSQTQQSGQTGCPLINNTSASATSASNEHDFLMPNDQDVTKEYSDKEKISEVFDGYEIMESNEQYFSQLINAENESVSSNNMSGSKTSSSFLNTAISERRLIFPSRLRSKAQNSTTGIGPPVLASQGSTTNLRYERVISESNTQYEQISNSTMQDEIGNSMPSSSMKVDSSWANKDLEGFEVNMATENTNEIINGDNEFHRDGSHPQQIKGVVNSVTLETSRHDETNSPPEDNLSPDESKDIQLPVPKPKGKLVPSQFPVNKYKLPTVSNPQRETVATPVKALPPQRMHASTSRLASDSVDGRQTVEPIIRKPPMESIASVPKKIKNFRFRQKMVLTGRLHHKSEENLKFFKQITKTDFYKDRARNAQ